MPNTEHIISKERFVTKRRHQTRKEHIENKNQEISSRYDGDINLYLDYCVQTEQIEGIESMLDYLYVSLTYQKVKKNTWERRLAAIRRYLTVAQDVNFGIEESVANELAAMRKMYEEEQNAHLIHVQGKSPVNKEELLELINQLPIRAKAICLVNLITANRPNEMVRIKVSNFNLEGRTVSIYLKKQKEWHNKRLTLDVIRSVRNYIKEYKLKEDDYFVGRVYKNGRYESSQISETAYAKSLRKWTGLTAYNFRKTQVVSMHEAGADLPTIAKQTGHQSLETITEHYLSISDTTVDKYL